MRIIISGLHILICSCLFFKNSFADIISINSVNSSTIDKMLNEIDKDTMVFIEIDNTLTIPTAKMFRPYSRSDNQFINSLIKLSYKFSYYKDVVRAWYINRDIELMELEWINFITNIKNKGAVVYGICSLPKFVVDLLPRRYLELRRLGIELTTKVNDQQTLEILDYKKGGTLFYMGILLRGNHILANAIAYFLNEVNIKPKNIIVISHAKYDLKKVDRLCEKLNINNHNIHYIKLYQEQVFADPKVVSLQKKLLLEKAIWLEDHEAIEVLNNRMK